MPFQPGDHVHVARFGTGIVLQARNAGRYLVDVKGRSMLVDEEQLTAAERRRHDQRPIARSDAAELADLHAGPVARASIDLHGLTVDQALSALDGFLNDAMLGGLPEVRVIHGVSGGRVRQAVHRRLEQLPTVRGFRVDPANAGVTIIVL